MSTIQAQIDEIEKEMARTQKNQATKYHLDRNFSVFALAAKGTANSGAVLSLGSNAGKTAIGGTINPVSIGINARF